MVGAFAKDDRILAWDVWNEPDNTNKGSYGAQEPKGKVARWWNCCAGFCVGSGGGRDPAVDQRSVAGDWLIPRKRLL